MVKKGGGGAKKAPIVKKKKEKSKRSTGSEVTVEDLTKMLLKHAVKRTFVRYAECEKVEDAPLLPAEIKKACEQGIVEDAWNLQKNLSFTKLKLQKAFKEVCKKKG